MAKDSDKNRLLMRRKAELDHAIRHGFDEVQMRKCGERVRAAVLAVLKKARSRAFPYSEESPEEIAWARMAIEDVIEKARHWGATPAARDLLP